MTSLSESTVPHFCTQHSEIPKFHANSTFLTSNWHVDSSEKGVECKSLLSNTQVVWDVGPCGLLDSHWISKRSNAFILKVKWTPNLTVPWQHQYMFVLASLWHVRALMSVLCCDTVDVHATEATVLDTLTACDNVMAGSSRMSRSRLK